MDKLRRKISNTTLYIAAIIACILILAFFLIYQNYIINNENKKTIGKVELYVKGLSRPQGMVIDRKGRLFVQSAADGKISLIKKDGTAMDYSYIKDYYGYGLDIDNYNNFIIPMQQQVAIIDSSDNVLKVFEGFKHAYDVAMGPNNLIFVSDSETNAIYTINPKKEITVFAELGDKLSQTEPNATGLCFDKDYKNLYAANMYTGDLFKIRLSNNYRAENIEKIASNLSRPNYIDMDEQGNVFISCIGDNTIIRINQNSIKELIDTKGKLSTPAGIVVHNENDKIVYVASKDTNSIYKITIGSNAQTKK